MKFIVVYLPLLKGVCLPVGYVRDTYDVDPIEHLFYMVWIRYSRFTDPLRFSLCRGLELASAETRLSAFAYNFKRVIKLIGLDTLMNAIKDRQVLITS